MDQFHWLPGCGIRPTPALPMLFQSPVQIIRVPDVEAAIGALEDVEREVHFASEEPALRLRRFAATLRVNGYCYRSKRTVIANGRPRIDLPDRRPRSSQTEE
jgi:hypothetical protein